jgi:DHA1 family tetracycline resistance protein-like MFS transporter
MGIGTEHLEVGALGVQLAEFTARPSPRLPLPVFGVMRSPHFLRLLPSLRVALFVWLQSIDCARSGTTDFMTAMYGVLLTGVLAFHAPLLGAAARPYPPRTDLQSHSRASVAVPRRPLLVTQSRPDLQAARRAPSPSLSTADAKAAEKPERQLQATAFVFVLGLSLVTLTPAPFINEQLGTARGMQLLTTLASSSAAAEICLSPLVGGLADSAGRKPVLLATLLTALLAQAACALWPSVLLVSIAKFISSSVIGIFFLAGGAIMADHYRTDPKRLAAASGIMFALVNAGFGLGIALCSLLPSGLRVRYAVSTLVALIGFLGALFGVRESLPASERVPFKARSFNPLSFTRLFALGERMRLLSLLAALTCAPLFMGDTLQVFAMNVWSLSEAHVSMLFTGVALSGVLSNVFAAGLIRSLGLQTFTFIATASTLLFWVGFSSANLKAAVACAAIGLLGPARTLGATTAMTAEGARQGIPQGQLSGDRANMIAWLKVVGPLVYGQLYIQGSAVGVPAAPFFLNVLLTIAALALGPMALKGATTDSQDQGEGNKKVATA